MSKPSWSNAAYAAAGLAWAIPALFAIWDGSLPEWRGAAWLLSAAGFAAAFAAFPASAVGGSRRAALVMRAGVMTVAACVMVASAVDVSRYASTLAFALVAHGLPSAVSRRVATSWVAAQCAILFSIFWVADGWLVSLSAGGVLVGFQYFALGRSYLVLEERKARAELERANAELRAARERLAERSREAERLRISRDLHDALGHHLAALSIRLDVASRHANGAAADDIREAHAIARRLLGDVRDVVGRLRDTDPVDLVALLAPLVDGSRSPRVHLAAPAALRLHSSAQADALFRCAQEIITNASRHANARNLWIDVAERDGGVELRARDDGCGAASPVCGHGLAGMKERFAEISGDLEFVTAPGEGFAVRAFAPYTEART